MVFVKGIKKKKKKSKNSFQLWVKNYDEHFDKDYSLRWKRKVNGFIEGTGYEDNFNLERLKFCVFSDVFFQLISTSLKKNVNCYCLKNFISQMLLFLFSRCNSNYDFNL